MQSYSNKNANFHHFISRNCIVIISKITDFHRKNIDLGKPDFMFDIITEKLPIIFNYFLSCTLSRLSNNIKKHIL